jgi:predicted enzyme related to lactoylglutathione lyase
MEDPKLKHGTFGWNELMTTDTAAAKEFYGKLFGWQTEDMPMGDFNYTILKIGTLQVGGLMPIPSKAKGTPPCWNSYVTVDDIDKTAAKAQELGGTIIVPPSDIPDVGRFAVIQDPQGAVISAITYLKK